MTRERDERSLLLRLSDRFGEQHDDARRRIVGQIVERIGVIDVEHIAQRDER